RRVMYVAMTRARERLYITNTKERFRFNETKRNKPSQFIKEAKGIYHDPFEVVSAFRKRNLIAADIVTPDVAEEREIVGRPKMFVAPSMVAQKPPEVFNKD